MIAYQGDSKRYQGDSKRFKKNTPGSSNTQVKPEKHTCTMCPEEHLTRKCPKFLKLNLTNRKEKARTANLCFNCLSPGHTIKDCKSGQCNRCEKKHNSLLCSENPNNRNVNSGQMVSTRKKKPNGKRSGKSNKPSNGQ